VKTAKQAMIEELEEQLKLNTQEKFVVSAKIQVITGRIEMLNTLLQRISSGMVILT
jgi:hypothetical protein